VQRARSSRSNLLGCVEEMEIRGSCNNVCALCWKESPLFLRERGESGFCEHLKGKSARHLSLLLIFSAGEHDEQTVVSYSALDSSSCSALNCQDLLLLLLLLLLPYVSGWWWWSPDWLTGWLLHEKRKLLLMRRRVGPLVRRLASPLFTSAS